MGRAGTPAMPLGGRTSPRKATPIQCPDKLAENAPIGHLTPATCPPFGAVPREPFLRERITMTGAPCETLAASSPRTSFTRAVPSSFGLARIGKATPMSPLASPPSSVTTATAVARRGLRRVMRRKPQATHIGQHRAMRRKPQAIGPRTAQLPRKSGQSTAILSIVSCAAQAAASVIADEQASSVRVGRGVYYKVKSQVNQFLLHYFLRHSAEMRRSYLRGF
jgi:hypothetical protein